LFIYFESELLLDPLFTVLLQMAVYKLFVWWETKSNKDIFYAGLLMGLASITRPTSLVLYPVIFLLIILILRNFKQLTKQTMLFILGTSLIIAPIFLRNVIIANDPVLISSQGGINLYIGNNAAADGISAVMPEPMGFNWRIQQITHAAEIETGHKLKPGQVSSFWADKAIEWISNHPASFFHLYLQKLYHNFSDREISNNRDLQVFFKKNKILQYNPLSFGILFALTVVGFFTGVKKNKKTLFILIVIAAYVTVSALFFFSSRFRLPLLPLYIIIASYTLLLIYNQITKKNKSALKLLGGIIVCGMFSFYPIIKLPNGSPSHFLISKGLYYSAIREYDKSLFYFQKANRIDPDFPETNLNIGNSFFRLGNTDSALYYFNQEKIINPGRTKAYTNIASVFLLKGEYEKALEEIKIPLLLTPYDVITNMIFLRALSYDSEINNNTLIDTVLKCANRTNDNIYFLNDAANILTEKGMLNIAESFLMRALNSYPPSIETDDEAFENNFKNSLSNWQNEKAKTYYQLGYINGLNKIYSKAVDFSNLAISIDSNFVEAYINLISGYLSSGQEDNARVILKIGLEKFPANRYILQMKRNLKQ
ncbi:MAG: tetratricopeptide repeat protein, partial [Candidatus Zixiibacteriota bacterium]